MNQVTLSGRLVADPAIRKNEETGSMVATYRLAINDLQNPVFVSCVAFGRRAGFAESNLHKGTKIEVVGSLRNNDYDDRDGQRHYRTEVVVQSQRFAEAKKRGIYDEYERLREMLGDDVNN